MDYANSKFTEAVKEYIHHERNREIMFLHFVQGWTYEELGAKYKLSARHVARICENNLESILKYL